MRINSEHVLVGLVMTIATLAFIMLLQRIVPAARATLYEEPPSYGWRGLPASADIEDRRACYSPFDARWTFGQ